MKSLVLVLILSAMATISACTSRDTSRQAANEKPQPATGTFINRVWIVAESEQVAQGDLRVFLSEGTLVMASPHGTPAFGKWSNVDGNFTITEESHEYPTDILELTRDTFRIRMHSPGEPVVIRFVPADPSPAAPSTSTTQGGTS